MPLDTKYHHASSEKRMAKKFQGISRYDLKKMGRVEKKCVEGQGEGLRAYIKDAMQGQ